MDRNELGDISKIRNRDEIKKLVEEKYDYTKRSQISTAAGQISRFLLELKRGDFVLSYDPSKRVYLVGTIESEYEYNNKIL